MKHNPLNYLLKTAVAFWMLACGGAMAASDTWVGLVDGAWSTSSNWQSAPVTVPGTGDTATFNEAGNGNTTINLGGGVTLGTLRFDSSYAATYTIGSGASGSQALTLDNGGTIAVNSGVVNNQGINARLSLSSVTNATAVITNSSAALLTLAGGIAANAPGTAGVLTVGGSGNVTVSGMVTNTGTSTNALLKTGSGTLTLSTNSMWSGAGALGRVPATSVGAPLVTREGTLLLNGGTHTVAGELVVGGVVVDGGTGQNAKVIVDNSRLNITGFLSVGRGNGIGGVSSDIIASNAAVITASDISIGFNGGSTLNKPKGSITLNNSASLTVSGGTVHVGESDNSDASLTLNDSATLGATAATISVGKNNGTGTLTIKGGSVSTYYLFAGVSATAASTCKGTVTVDGGSLASEHDIVVGSGGSGAGGAFGTLIITNGGTVNQGTTTVRWLKLNRYDTTRGQVDVNGGHLNINASSCIRCSTENSGSQGTSVINLLGGNITFYSDNHTTVGGTGVLDLQYYGGAGSSATINLAGGALTVPQVISTLTSGTRTFNFNGGTLKAAVSSTAFLNLGSGNARANVRNGGAIIDTNGKNVTIAQALLHSNIGGDAATDGGLIKLGAGALTLTGLNTYNGPSIVSNGVLAVYGPSLGGAISLASNTVLLVTNAVVGGSMTAAAGSRLALTNGVAGDSLTVSNGLTLNDGVILNVDYGATVDKLVVIGGGFTNTGVVIIRLNGLTGYSSGSSVLIQTAGGEITSTNGFILDSTGIVGATASLLAEGGNLKLVTTLPDVALWWKGDVDGLWNTTSPGYNWDTDQASGIDAGALPGTATNVVFAANNASTLNTTLGQDFAVNRVIFNTNGVTIGGANTLTINVGIDSTAGGGTNTISSSGGVALGGDQLWSNAPASVLAVSSPISGAKRITKVGSGTLALSGSSTFTGGAVLNEGSLHVNHAAALGNSTNGDLTINGGVLDNTSGNPITTTAAKAQTWAGDFTFGGTTNLSFNSGAVTIPGTGARTVAVSSGVLNVGRITGASAGLTLTGSGMLSITEDSTASSTLGGTLTVSGGSILRINTGGDAATSFDFYAAGLAGSGVVENGAGTERWLYITNTNDFTFSGVLRNGGSGALGLNKSGNGTLTLNGANHPYTGTTTIQSGTLQIGDGTTDSVMTNSSTIVNSGTLVFNVVSSNSYGHIISGAGSLVKNGTGVLTLSGANSYGGSTIVNGGTLTVVTGGIANSSGRTGGTYFNVGTVSNANTVLRINGGAANLYTSSGNAWASYMTIGNGAGCRGFVSMTSGSLTAQRHFVVGNITGGFGAMTMTTGSVSVGSYFITGFNGGVGVFNQNGGAVTQNQTAGAGATLIGSGPGSLGVMTLLGGSFTATAGGIQVSENNTFCTGILNIGGSASVTAGNIGVKFGGDNATAKGILNLMGGALTANVVQRGNGSAIFNFHGGILKASTNNTTFMTGLSAAYVYPEGAVIHDNSNAVTIAQALIAPVAYGVASIALTNNGSGYIDTPVVTLTGGSGSYATAIAQIDYTAGTVTNILVTNPGSGYGSGDTVIATLSGGGGSGAGAGTVTLSANTSGGLVKLGTGTLSLMASNTFSGATSVSNGTLAVNGSLPGVVAVYSNTTLSGTGRVYGAVSAAAGGSIRAGLPGGTGTLWVAQASLNNAILGVNLNSNLTCNVLNVGGSLSVGGASLNVADTNQLLAITNKSASFVVATASSVSGQFVSSNLPRGWWVVARPSDVIITQNSPGFLLIVQ